MPNNILIIFWDGQEPCAEMILENPSGLSTEQIAARLDDILAGCSIQALGSLDNIPIHVRDFLENAKQPGGHVWTIKKPATTQITVDELLSQMELAVS